MSPLIVQWDGCSVYKDSMLCISFPPCLGVPNDACLLCPCLLSAVPGIFCVGVRKVDEVGNKGPRGYEAIGIREKR